MLCQRKSWWVCKEKRRTYSKIFLWMVGVHLIKGKWNKRCETVFQISLWCSCCFSSVSPFGQPRKSAFSVFPLSLCRGELPAACTWYSVVVSLLRVCILICRSGYELHTARTAWEEGCSCWVLLWIINNGNITSLLCLHYWFLREVFFICCGGTLWVSRSCILESAAAAERSQLLPTSGLVVPTRCCEHQLFPLCGNTPKYFSP